MVQLHLGKEVNLKERGTELEVSGSGKNRENYKLNKACLWKIQGAFKDNW